VASTSDKVAALAKRYGGDAVPTAGPWNGTLDLLLAHASVRGYKPDALPASTFETLVAAGQSAATGSNMQTWSVIAVTDPDKKAQFAAIAGGQKHIEQCPLFLVFLADLSRHHRIEAADGVTLEGLPYLETFLVSAIDAALAAQNAVIAAESLGLATVYIGALRNKPLEVARLLALPPGAMGVFGLCVGYAADGAMKDVKPRLPQAAIAFRETYQAADEVALRRQYDAAMAAFAGRNEGVADSWTRRVMNRLGQVRMLGGRDKLKDALQALGFPLR
jgi:nitroreductase